MYLNNYQSFLFGAVIIGLVAFVACKKSSETQKIVGFSIKTELSQTENTWFGASNITGVKIKIYEINDRTCTEDLVCVWGGEAWSNLMSGNLTDSISQQIEQSPPKNEIQFKLGNKNYKAVLYDVNVYPNSTKTESNKNATFAVTNTKN